MKKPSTTALVGLVATAVASGAMVGLSAGSAGAAGDPGVVVWSHVDPDRATGTLALYDASKTTIDHGTLDSPIAAFAVGPAVAGATKATLFAYTPQTGGAPGDPFDASGADAPAGWSGLQLTGSTTIGDAFSGAYASVDSSATTLAQYIAALPSTDADHPNIYELRLRTSSSGASPSGTYAAVDIEVDPAANLWWLANTDEPTKTATTTSLAATPAGAHPGDTVTLTATTSVPGKVTFAEGDTVIAADVATTGAAPYVATTTVPAGAVGDHTYTATLTPTDTDTYRTSSGPVVYTVAAATTATTATLSISPTSVAAGAPVDAYVTVAPPTPGTVTYFDGVTQIGSATINDQGQQPSVTPLSLAAGTHQITAVFAPTNTDAFVGDTTDVVTVTVTPAPVVDTATVLALSKTSVITGTAVTATATVTPHAAGTVTFKDGATTLATAKVSASGVATASIKPTAIKTHVITASFLPTDLASYKPSTSKPVNLKVANKSLGKLKETFPASVKKGKKATGKITLSTPSKLTTTVKIYEGKKLLKSVKLKKGVSAKITLAKFKKGTHKLTVKWAGNASYKATSLAFTIKQK